MLQGEIQNLQKNRGREENQIRLASSQVDSIRMETSQASILAERDDLRKLLEAQRKQT